MSGYIYDNEDFLRRYRDMRRFKPGLLHRGFEWASFQALLPPLRNAAVLDLGCGDGDLCRYVRAEGAAPALGLDLSQDMIATARRENADPAIRYEAASLETFSASPGADVSKRHRTLAGYVNPILEAGLTLKRLEEPKPSAAVLQAFPDMALEGLRPPFMVIRADRPT